MEVPEFVQDCTFNLGKRACKAKPSGGKTARYACADSSCSWEAKVYRRALRDKSTELYVSSVQPPHRQLCASYSKPSERQLQRLETFVTADKRMSFKALTHLLQKCDHVNVQTQPSIVQRAKVKVRDGEVSNWADSFALIAPLVQAFRAANPGTRVSVDVDPTSRFVRAFVVVDGAVRAIGHDIRLMGV